MMLVELESLWSQLEDNPSKETLFFYLFGSSDYDCHPLMLSSGSQDLICQTTWGKGGIAFRCLDCEQDTNCVVCCECFFDSEAKHERHRVKLIRTTGGCCDCGDVSSWSESGFCSKHGPKNQAKFVASPSLSESERCRLVANCENLVAITCEIITRSITTEVDKEILQVCLEFLLELCRISCEIFRPIVLRHLSEEVLSPWIQVACILGGSHPRPRPPVDSIPSREDCSEIAESLCDFFLSLVQLSSEFKLEFSKSYLAHYGEIVQFKGDFDESSSRGDLSSLSVQLFTIPEVCVALLHTEPMGILEKLIDSLLSLIAHLHDPHTKKLARDIRPDIDVTLWRVVHDFGYCLHHQEVCEFLLQNECLLEKLVRCMQPLQHTNIQSVKTGDHVLYENALWRTSFRLELLFLNTLAPLLEFSRKRRMQNNLLVAAIQVKIGPFDLLQMAGEKATFHIPLSRIVFKSISIENFITQNSVEPWMKSVFTLPFLRTLLLESLRPQLFSEEISHDVWVRNGDAMRLQQNEYLALFDMDLTGTILVLVVLGKLGFEPMTEFMRCFILLVADIPDDTTTERTILTDRIAFFSDSQQFGIDQIDDWWQLFLRDVIIGGSGNATDKRRRKAAFQFLIETLCRVTTDSCSVELSQLDSKDFDSQKRKGLITRCLVQRMPNQRFSYSQILNLLPSALRQPENLVDQVLERIAMRDRSSDEGVQFGGCLYKLNPEALKLFEITHKAFAAPVSESAGMEEFSLRNAYLFGSNSACWDDKITNQSRFMLLGTHGFVLRMISSLIRVRLCEHYSPHCLVSSDSPPAETPPNELDGLILFCLKILDNLKSAKAVTALSESHPVWSRPPLGVRMTLQGLQQRTDLNGCCGIYFGKQDGRLCVTMADNGKLLAKESNTDRIPGPETGSYAVSILSLLEDLLSIPKSGTTDLILKCVKILIERFSHSTGVASRSHPRSDSPSGNESIKLRAIEAKNRQKLLLAKMKEKQLKFKDPSPTNLQNTEPHEGSECAMCREASTDTDPLVALAYCAAGNAIERTSPAQVCLASPSSPFINACLHTVHLSCWNKHTESSATQSQRGGLFLQRQDHGEANCPVCRTLANVAIPVIGPNEGPVSDEVFEAIVELGQTILKIAKEHANPSAGVWDLWLTRYRGNPRPLVFSPASDAIAEAALNELLLSIALSPSKVLSLSSLHVLLVRCFRASFKHCEVIDACAGLEDNVDCARFFLESTWYENKVMIRKLLVLRHLQLVGTNCPDYDLQMAHLAVFMSWVCASVDTSFTPSDLNRIGYLPEDPKSRLSVCEQLLDVSQWRSGVLQQHPRKSLSPVPHPMGGLVEFINLPEKLTDLIRMTINRTCEKCKTKPQDPAICLLCGALLCLDSDCCKGPKGEGECTRHAESCGAGQSVFILPYASIVVAVASPRNCIWDGPYEDSHGEPDSYMKRSCKLTLSQHRLDRMRLLYTRGSIPIEIVKQNQITGRYVPRQL